MNAGPWRYLLFRLAAWSVPHIDEPAGYQLFGRVADVIYLVARRTRDLVECNLTHALGPGADQAHLHRVARHIFRNLLWNYYELFHMPVQTIDELRGRISVEGVSYAEEAVRGGTGSIFVFPHMGNLEVLLQIPLLYPQYRFLILVERMPDDRIFYLMRSLRGARGVQLASTGDMLRIIRLFKKGWSLVLAGDLDSTESGIAVNFFGAPARMPDGAVRIALRTGAPLLIVYGWRHATGASVKGKRLRRSQFRLCITPPLPLTRSGDYRADVQRGVEDVVKQLEGIVAAHLDQWLAFHPIWQEVPP